MSSARSDLELVPTKGSVRFLLAFSAGATLTGALLIALLPLKPAVKAAFGCLWLLQGLLEFRCQLRGARRIDRIRMSAGGPLQGIRRGAPPEPLELLPGSLVLSRVAWLRLRFRDGLAFGELLAGDARRDARWRRLQLIWRQHGPIFGGLKGS